jgi:glycosyltransferase involved in cell wall biosynthesis
VSVVIPAFRAEKTLGLTLASLAGQSYPDDLLEVIVVDDEGDLVLPDIRPSRTRVVRAQGSWGRANACATGAARAHGDVLHWVDADMLLHRSHVEAHARWHHLLDHAVVTGHKVFLDPEEGLPDPVEVKSAVERDTIEALLGDRWSTGHKWVEQFWDRTLDLATAGYRAYQVYVGATASVGRALYQDSGGMNPGLRLGEDIELGYRLSNRGGVFVPDREARSWHLGRSLLMDNEQALRRYNDAHLAALLPDLRRLRRPRGRSYSVPILEVVVVAEGQSYEDVRFTVDGVLDSVPGDVRCVVTGPWGSLTEDRRSPLEDPLLDYRLLRAEYAGEPRVELVEALPPALSPAVFRMYLPTGWRPGPTTLPMLIKDMQKRAQGLRQVVLDDGRTVRIERTAAVGRARRVRRPDEIFDDVLDALTHTWWSEGAEDGFVLKGQEPLGPGEPKKRDPSPPQEPVRSATSATSGRQEPGLGRGRGHSRRLRWVRSTSRWAGSGA